MLKTIREFTDWTVLNAYAILLDAVALGAGLLSISLLWNGHPILAGLAVMVAAFSGCSAIELHGSYFYKRKLFRILIRKNRNRLQPETFDGRFDAPCHRLLVRLVLHRIGRADAYRGLFRRYYIPPWKRFRRDTGTFIIFKTPEEGKQWLLRQNNRIF